MVEEKVSSGAYESEGEVIREGLRALQAQDAVLEEWLRTEGVARYDAYRRDADAAPVGEAFTRVRARHTKMIGE